MASLTNIQFTRLKELVVEAFNPDSLSQLVRMELGADMYKEYVPTGKPFQESVFLLIGALEERGTTISLVNAVLAARPQKAEIQSELPQMRADLALSSPESPAQVRVVEAAIRNAAGTLASATLSEPSTALLRRLRSDLELIQIYKALHDCLHKTQLHLSVLESDSQAVGVPGQEEAADRFERALDVFLMEGMNARQAAAGLPRDPAFLRESEESWLRQYDASVALAKTGLEKGDAKSTRAASSRLRSVLRREPGRIDGILRSCAGSLDLDGLRALLDQGAQAEGGGPEGHRVFSDGRQAVELLFRKLRALVNQHNQWQLIDLALWEAEDQLPGPNGDGDSGGIFEILWDDLSASLQLLVDSDPGSGWSVGLRAQRVKADEAWEAKSWPVLARAFRQFRKTCLMNFFAADSALKGLTDELSRLRGALSEILTKLNP